MRKPSKKHYIEAFKQFHNSDDCEIALTGSGNPRVVLGDTGGFHFDHDEAGDRGAWVNAWVWIREDEAEICRTP